MNVLKTTEILPHRKVRQRKNKMRMYLRNSENQFFKNFKNRMLIFFHLLTMEILQFPREKMKNLHYIFLKLRIKNTEVILKMMNFREHLLLSI